MIHQKPVLPFYFLISPILQFEATYAIKLVLFHYTMEVHDFAQGSNRCEGQVAWTGRRLTIGTSVHHRIKVHPPAPF